MFRIVAHQFGPPEQVLAYEPVGKPVLEPSWVLVRMRASAINPSDLIPVAGAYRHRTSLPFVPGYDGVGIIMETGSSVDPVMVGRRVLPLGSAGNWQGWKALPADWCVRVPDDLSDEQAVVAYVNPLTARLMVKSLAPQPGDRIGITAAASAIGRMLVRMLAVAGARPVAIVRSQSSSRAALQDEPVDEVIQEGAPLPTLTAGLDSVGGQPGARLAAAIQPGGLLLHYGLLSGQPLKGALLVAAKANIRLFRLRDWVHAAPRAALHAAMAETFVEIRAGSATTFIAACYPMAAFQEAIAHNAQSDRRGKVILHP
jgi:NADPH:quinone reductase-like Zn-dependent oxidoreductase